MFLSPTLVTLPTRAYSLIQEWKNKIWTEGWIDLSENIPMTDLSLVQVGPVGRHLIIEVETFLVLVRTVLGELVGLHLAVLVLHQEAGHGMVGPGAEVLVDPVVGDVGTAGFQHPVVSVVELSTLTRELTPSHLSLHLPGDIKRDRARHCHLLVRVAGDGEEGVPGVEFQGLRQVVDPTCQVDGGHVLNTGRVVVVSDSSNSLHSVAKASPGRCLIP